jgi:hypothetical protein
VYNVQHILKEKLREKWCDTLFDSAKCLNYILFKTESDLEPYITHLPEAYTPITLSYVDEDLAESMTNGQSVMGTHRTYCDRSCNFY